MKNEEFAAAFVFLSFIPYLTFPSAVDRWFSFLIFHLPNPSLVQCLLVTTGVLVMLSQCAGEIVSA